MTDGVRTDITKQEVVSRQLETAIVFFFSDDDAISIHTLASAASQILYDLCRKIGKPSIRERWQDLIVKEHQREWHTIVTRAYNFFKHAKNDAFTNLTYFNHRSNMSVLFNACMDYITVYTFSDAPVAVSTYFAWYVAANPSFLRHDHPLANVIKESPFNGLDKKTPHTQRQMGAEMLRAAYANIDKRPPVTGLTDDPSDIGISDNVARTIPEYGVPRADRP